MSTTDVKRVVEMAFKGKDFEKGVDSSLKNVDKLKKGLNFSEAENHLIRTSAPA